MAVGVGVTGARRSRRIAVATVALGGLAALGIACADLPTGSDTPFSLEFKALPSPAVVMGDSLRDAQGVAMPLIAIAYNGAGDPIPGAAITYRLPDAGVELLAGDFVRAGAEARTGLRVIAQVDGISSLPLLLDVVPSPDSLHLTSAARDTVRFSIPGSATADMSSPVEARVLHRPATGAPVGVRSWRVRYAVVVGADTLAPGDTSLMWMVDDRGRPSAVDTTDGSGAAARRLRLSVVRPADLAALDSVIVIVSATDERNEPLADSPATVTLFVRQRTATP